MILTAILFRRVRQAIANANANQGIRIDRNAFTTAQNQLRTQITALRTLRNATHASFANLRRDWDSAAGRAFFNKFENELLTHIDQYATKLDQRSQSLNWVVSQYNEVFTAADAVANARY